MVRLPLIPAEQHVPVLQPFHHLLPRDPELLLPSNLELGFGQRLAVFLLLLVAG